MDALERAAGEIRELAADFVAQHERDNRLAPELLLGLPADTAQL